MRTRTFILAGLWSLCALPLPLAAQGAPPAHYRQGFWIGFGPGAGHAQMDCSGCGSLRGSDPRNGGGGFSWHLALGGTPRPNLLVGGGISSYTRKGGEQTWSELEAVVSSYTVVLQYYPSLDSKFFVKGGVGYGWYYIEEYHLKSFVGRTSSGAEGETNGFALQGGMGYDVLLTRRLALVPFANAVQVLASGEKHPVAGVPRMPSNPGFVQLGVGVQWY
jgi:hypothetical protein